MIDALRKFPERKLIYTAIFLAIGATACTASRQSSGSSKISEPRAGQTTTLPPVAFSEGNNNRMGEIDEKIDSLQELIGGNYSQEPMGVLGYGGGYQDEKATYFFTKNHPKGFYKIDVECDGTTLVAARNNVNTTQVLTTLELPNDPACIDETISMDDRILDRFAGK